MRPSSWLPLLLPLCLAGCLAQPARPPRDREADRLLRSGLEELLERRHPHALERLSSTAPTSEQGLLAARLLAWHARQQQPAPSPPTPAAPGRKSSDQELRELKEENRKLRKDLEQLRRLLIESERRAR